MDKKEDMVRQDQIHDLLFGEKLSWQAIIYDLINTEQLDPWNIDLTLLSSKYLEKIKDLEEENFFVSSKVLLAASFLLRIKADILLNSDLPGLDSILYGKKENKSYEQERIELEDGEIPDIIPRTPLPRFRRVTLAELMSSLGKAIKTENRRIKREIIFKHEHREAGMVITKNLFNLQDKIKEVYSKLKKIFSNREKRFAFSELIKGSNKKTKEEKINSFISLLHLDNQQKVWLEQEGHFEEIWIMLKSLYEKHKSEESNVETGFGKSESFQ